MVLLLPYKGNPNRNKRGSANHSGDFATGQAKSDDLRTTLLGEGLRWSEGENLEDEQGAANDGRESNTCRLQTKPWLPTLRKACDILA